MAGSPIKRARRSKAVARAHADARSDYAISVARFREDNPDVWNTEDILAACCMEINGLGQMRDASSQRLSWMKLALDARKQLHLEAQAIGANKPVLVTEVESADSTPLAALFGPQTQHKAD